MSGQEIPFGEISRAALADRRTLLRRWLPDGRIDGNEYVATNPTRSDKRPGSFKINMDTGIWSDFATGDSGGDLIDFYKYLFGVDTKTAALELGRHVGVISGTESEGQPREYEQREYTAAAPNVPPTAQWQPILPADGASRPTFRHGRLGKPSTHWQYNSAETRLLGFTCRFDTPDGGKETLPYTFCECVVPGFSSVRDGKGCGKYWQAGDRLWRWKGWEEPRPMYNLHLLAARPNDPVLLVEGEKTADAAGLLIPDHVPMAWPGGCKAIEKVDFTPLEGRRIIYLPDADQPGKDCAWGYWKQNRDGSNEFKRGLYHILGPICDLTIIDPPPGVPNGWDLADVELGA